MGSIIPETHCLRKHFFSFCSDFFRWPLHCRRSGIPVSKSTPLMVSSSQKRRSSLLYREILWFTVCAHQAASSSFFLFCGYIIHIVTVKKSNFWTLHNFILCQDQRPPVSAPRR